MPTASPISLRLATFNIRYDKSPDGITVSESISSLDNPLREHSKFLRQSGEQAWSARRLRVAESLSSEKITVAGFQEASERQVQDLARFFGNRWGCVGVGSADRKTGGEYCPLFYKKHTPSKASKYPGADNFRLCTVARFSANTGGKTKFTVLNTHLDARSDKQRRLGASLILARARYEAVTFRRPVFVMGDLNSTSSGEDSGAYKIITGASAPVNIDTKFAVENNVGHQLPDFEMLDLRGQAPRERVSNNFVTYTGFNKPSDTSGWKRIDYIFGGSNLRWKSKGYKVRSSLSDDGILASDHRLVFADVTI